jgi:ABC-2 type transport system ATP-binding protein
MRELVRRLAAQGLTVLLSSHAMNEVEDLCDRVAIVRSGRIVHAGSLRELIAGTTGHYELRTTDDERAAEIARHERGIDAPLRGTRGLTFSAGEEAAARLSIALGEAGIGISALVPRSATLEELFFRMTEGEPATASPPHQDELIEEAAR